VAKAVLLRAQGSYSSLLSDWFAVSKGEPMGADLLSCRFPPSLYVPVSFCMWFNLFAVGFMMEAIFSSEMLVNFHQTTECYIPENKLFIGTAMRTSNPTSSITSFIPYTATE
jgi:hypothetical protein